MECDPATKKGFTLTELLVTVAIISILAALAFSSYSKVQLSKNALVCVNNLRAIGMAINLYSQENDGKLPGPAYSGVIPYYHDPSRATGFQNLCDYLASKMDLPAATGQDEKLAKIFVCPSWTAWRGRQPTTQEKVYMVPFQVILDDGSSFTPFGYPGATTTNPKKVPIKVVQMSSPSSLVAVYDADASATGGVPSWSGTVPPQPVHSGKRNYLFFDGHIEALTNWP